MERITIKHLEAIAHRLNKMTDSPTTYMDGNRNILVGHFHIDRAYSGFSLHRTANSSGGVTQPMGHAGSVPARELYEKMHAFMAGIEFATRSNKE